MVQDPLLELDLSFSYDPSDLKNLTSAQLTVLASSLHSERVDPFVVAEARTLFTTRRGNELGAEFVTREALKAAKQRATFTDARTHSAIHLGPEWGIFATKKRSDSSDGSSRSSYSVPQLRPTSPLPRRDDDRAATSPPLQLAPIDLTSLSDGEDKEHPRHHRRRHSRSRSPSRHHSHRRSRSSRSRSRSRSPARRPRREKRPSRKRSRSSKDTSRLDDLPEEVESSRERRRRKRRRDEHRRSESPASNEEEWRVSRVAVGPNWNWESLVDEIEFLQYAVGKMGDNLDVSNLCPRPPRDPDLLFLPATVPSLSDLNTTVTLPPPDTLSASQLELLEKCQLEALQYIYAIVPPPGLHPKPTQQHVAALRAVPPDPNDPVSHFRRYWLGLADVRRSWTRVRIDMGGGRTLWQTVATRLLKKGNRAGDGADERMRIMAALEEGMRAPSSREGIVRQWKERGMV